MTFADASTEESVVWALANIGAINWGLTEAFDINLVTELVGTGNAGLVYIAVGVAGALALAANLGVVDLSTLLSED